MEKAAILKIFKDTEALLEGHFILTSGRRSAVYFQCAKVLQYPRHLTSLATMIADHFKNQAIDYVISPAIGGVVVGTEVGRLLDKQTIFAERKSGTMTIRRGFEIQPGAKILVVEDVVTTGGSVQEVIDLVTKEGAEVIGVGVIVDRSNGTVKLHENQYAVLQMESVSYLPDDIPPELAKLPPVKPGSRGIN